MARTRVGKSPVKGGVRRNITQGLFTVFRRNAPRLIGLYAPRVMGNRMPACFRLQVKDQGRNKVPNDDGWREPPGYLGEAVRRAKLIPSRANRANKTEPLPAAD